MSIDRTSPLKPVSTVQPRETTDAPVTNTRAAKTTASTSTSVTLSDAQAKLMQPGSSDINLERVEPTGAGRQGAGADRSKGFRF